MELEQLIIDKVKELSRRYEKVYPYMLEAHGVPYTERHLRRHLARLAREGRIYRMGPRKGYIARA